MLHLLFHPFKTWRVVCQARAYFWASQVSRNAATNQGVDLCQAVRELGGLRR